VLPQALELARSSLALRPLVQPLLGERGVWLAHRREDWQFAAGVAGVAETDPRRWDEGTLEQRKAFLAAFTQLSSRIRLFLNLPFDKLERHTLKAKLRDIGRS